MHTLLEYVTVYYRKEKKLKILPHTVHEDKLYMSYKIRVVQLSEIYFCKIKFCNYKFNGKYSRK